MMRGPVWGGPQAAGKRHSQPFSQKRLPHPRRRACERRAAVASWQVALAAAKFAGLWILDWTLVS